MEPVIEINPTAFYSYVLVLQTQKISLSLMKGLQRYSREHGGWWWTFDTLTRGGAGFATSSVKTASHHLVPHSREDPTDRDPRHTKNSLRWRLYWCIDVSSVRRWAKHASEVSDAPGHVEFGDATRSGRPLTARPNSSTGVMLIS